MSVVIVEGGETENPAAPEGERSISAEALELIRASSELNANLVAFREEIRTLTHRLETHEQSNASDFETLRAGLAECVAICAAAEKIAVEAAAVAEEIEAEEIESEEIESEGIADETPASVEAAEASEPALIVTDEPPPAHDRKRHFVSL